MLDLGWTELLLVAVVTLIVVGPKELPGVLRTVTGLMRRARAMAREFQRGLEDMARESGVDEIKRDLQKATSAKDDGLDDLLGPVPGLDDKADPAASNSIFNPTTPMQAKPTARGSKARGSKARGSKVRGSKAGGAKARGAKARGAKARGAKARGAKAGGSKVRGTEASDTKAPDTKVRRAEVNGNGAAEPVAKAADHAATTQDDGAGGGGAAAPAAEKKPPEPVSAALGGTEPKPQ